MCRWDRLWLVGFCALVLQRCFLEKPLGTRVRRWHFRLRLCPLFFIPFVHWRQDWGQAIPLLVNSGIMGITGHNLPLSTFSHILPPTLILNKKYSAWTQLVLAHLSSMLRCSLSPGVPPPPTGPLVLSCAQAAVSREGRSYPSNCGRARGWAAHLVVSDLPPRTVRRHRDRGRAESGWGAGRASHLECKRVRGTAKWQQSTLSNSPNPASTHHKTHVFTCPWNKFLLPGSFVNWKAWVVNHVLLRSQQKQDEINQLRT